MNRLLFQLGLAGGIILFLFLACELEEKQFIKPVPIGGEPTDISEVSFKAHWHKIVGAKTYTVDVSTSAEFEQSLPGYTNKEVADTFLLIVGLKANTQYYYRVGFERNNILSTKSEPVAAKTITLGTPLALPAKDISQISITAQWEPVAGAEAYQVEFSDNPAFDNPTDFPPVRVSETEYIFEELRVFKTYYYRIKAISGENFSEPSKIISARTTNLTKPVLLEASEIQPNTFKVKWEEVPGASSYLVDVSTEATFSSFVEGYEAKEVNTVSEVIINLLANEDYYFRVRAKSNETTSAYSSIGQVHTSAISLAIPLAHEAINSTYSGFTLSWDASSVAESYVVYLFYDEDLTQPVENWEKAPTVDTELQITGLQPSTTFYYYVRAKGLGGLSEPSNTVEVSTSDFPIPVPLAATEVKEFSFIAHWEAVEDFSTYDIQLSEDINFGLIQQQHEVTNTLEFKFEDLIPRKSFYYRIRCKNELSTSAYSAPMQVNTTDIGTPVALAANALTPFSFVANWQTIADADEYILQISTDPNFSSIDIEKRTSNGYFSVEDLVVPNTAYYYRLLSVKKGHISQQPSNTISLKTPAIQAPVAQNPTDQHAFGFTANWSLIDEASSYEFSLATDAAFTNLVAGYEAKSLFENHLEIDKLDHTTTYYYRIRSKSEGSFSDYSVPIEVKPIVANCQLKRIVNRWWPYIYDISIEYNNNNLPESFYLSRINTDNDFSFQISYDDDNKTIHHINKYTGTDFEELVERWVANRGDDGKLLSWVVRAENWNLIMIRKFSYDENGRILELVDYSDWGHTKVLNSRKFIYTGDELVSIDLNNEREYNYKYDENTLNPLKLLNPELSSFMTTFRGTTLYTSELHCRAFEYWEDAEDKRHGYYYYTNKLKLPNYLYGASVISYIYNEGCPIK